ncbi:MAG: hypothetical protein ABJC51_05170 [Acidobacteriota bacterium]
MNRQHLSDRSDRVRQALLAFPLALLVGLGGSVAFRAAQAWQQVEPATSPAPARTDSDHPPAPEAPDRPALAGRQQVV